MAEIEIKGWEKENTFLFLKKTHRSRKVHSLPQRNKLCKQQQPCLAGMLQNQESLDKFLFSEEITPRPPSVSIYYLSPATILLLFVTPNHFACMCMSIIRGGGSTVIRCDLTAFLPNLHFHGQLSLFFYLTTL